MIPAEHNASDNEASLESLISSSDIDHDILTLTEHFQKVACFPLYSFSDSAVAMIDKTNLASYQKVSRTYKHTEHRTIRNFDEANKKIIHKFFFDHPERLFSTNIEYLDIGPGSGETTQHFIDQLDTIAPNSLNVSILDLSEHMLEECSKFLKTPIRRKILGSINQNSIIEELVGEKFNLVSGFLCDPYLTQNALYIIKSILKPKGILLLTYPTPIWATSARDGQSFFKAKIKDEKNVKQDTFSFCPSVEPIIKVGSDVGLTFVSRYDVAINELSDLSTINKKFKSDMGENAIILTGLLFQAGE